MPTHVFRTGHNQSNHAFGVVPEEVRLDEHGEGMFVFSGSLHVVVLYRSHMCLVRIASKT